MTKFKFAQLDKQAEKAMREAVQKVVIEHKRLKMPLSVWKDGKVVRVPAKQVKSK